jgi:hypothetical protein
MEITVESLHTPRASLYVRYVGLVAGWQGVGATGNRLTQLLLPLSPCSVENLLFRTHRSLRPALALITVAGCLALGETETLGGGHAGLEGGQAGVAIGRAGG